MKECVIVEIVTKRKRKRKGVMYANNEKTKEKNVKHELPLYQILRSTK